MMAPVKRREVLDGSSLTKRFYDPDGFRSKLPPGWSPVLVVSLGAIAANFGSSARSKRFDEMRALSSGGVKNQGFLAASNFQRVPIVAFSPARKNGQVSAEVTAPNSLEDPIDYIWLADATTGEIFSGRKFLPSETPRLVTLVDRGRRIVPFVHCTVDGVWEGDAAVAEP